jgi:hypothetical protein
MRFLKPFLLPLAAFILITIAAAWADSHLPSRSGGPPMQNYSWSGCQLAACYPGCFCEAFRAGGVVQPLSAYSNLFYILAGLLILGARNLPAQDARNNRMTRRRGYITGYGCAVVAIGATSLFFHISLTQIGRWLDYMGMYAFTGYALIYSLARFRRWNDRTFVALYAFLLTALGVLWFAAPDLRRLLLGALILGVIVVEAVVHWVRRPMRIPAGQPAGTRTGRPVFMKTGYLVAALACFFAAYAVNLADESGALCVPASLWQWHAVWHFMTAVSTVLLYVYYWSEEEG